MSAWEELPSADEFDSEGELEDYMRDTYRDLRNWWRERRYHDRNGYFAEIAGSAKCEALGHKPDPDEGWCIDDHSRGWGGEFICEATRYGEACSECEGECDFEFFDPSRLWKAVAA